MRISLFILLAILLLACILLNKAYRTLPPQELRRRARGGHDKAAAAVYKAAAYGEGLELFLWLVGSISAAALIVEAADFGWWLATILVLAAGFFIFLARPSRRADGWQWQAAAFIAPVVAKLMSWLQPVFGRGSSLVKDWYPAQSHSGLYEREDLLELLKSQNKQLDNRFSDAELAIIYGALTFGDKSVGQIMTPRAKLKLVLASESAGPHLMDELHASGLAAFPVVKETSKSGPIEVVGTIYLTDLVDNGTMVKVRDVMRKKVYFINEAQNLREALAAFIKTRAHLLIVVNSFEEVAGGLTIEQIAEQILGHKMTVEFDGYDDISTVAGLK